MLFEDFYENYLSKELDVEYDENLSLLKDHENSRDEIDIQELQFSKEFDDDFRINFDSNQSDKYQEETKTNNNGFISTWVPKKSTQYENDWYVWSAT